jgi:hypothetical protein
MRILGALVVVLLTVPVSVLLLKAKGWLCLLSLLIPVGGFVLAVVGASRLAKPHSWWARNVYRDTEVDLARRRYPDAPATPETVLANLGWLLLALFTALAALYALGVVDP